MPKSSRSSSDYEYIAAKIDTLRGYNFFRNRPDSYIFSALCVKSHFYKNPALLMTQNELEDMIVDGAYDGGVDILLADPSSETCDLVIGQSKFYQNITFDDVLNALIKMANFYKDMTSGKFDGVKEKVQQRFLTLDSDTGEESKIIFVLFTSAPQGKINIDRLESKFKEQFSDPSNIEVNVLFASDIVNGIKEAESRRPTVESGKLYIDRAGNILEYGDDAVIVNISALSLKRLYGMHGTNLLARNLRYHIKSGREIDRAIDETINTSPASFWLKNNGITIICDSFSADGKEIKLTNFSIINGGQTVYIIHRNKRLIECNDFYLPCKIIQAQGSSEDEKNLYSLEIAKAANSQKPIRDIDLKANAPEQVRFARAMREAGIFYQTKRGEDIPKAYKPNYLNTDLAEVGKLCLCAVFQIPGISRSKPSSLYKPKYYDIIFRRDPEKIARICRELLYIDDFFRSTFIKEYDRNNKGEGKKAEDKISFAHNARTACIAFVAFASRYIDGNLTDRDVDSMTYAKSDTDIYDIFRELDGFDFVLPPQLFAQKDKYDDVLRKLFNLIISSGITAYTFAKGYDPSVTATNFLKADKNYYKIISAQWPQIKSEIKKIFDDISA